MESATPIAIDQTTQSQPTPPQSPIRKWGSLLTLSLALAIIIIDSTLLNVSLSTLIRELHTDIQNLQWVITAYALVLAALTITGGRLGDLFGRKKMFMLGAAIFAAGSFIASISNNIPTMIIGESIIEGIGAAMMMPATASLLIANFHGKDRATAFGVWGAVAGASSAIGPLLGGFLTSHYSWRWGFRINVFMAALLITAALALIEESHDEKEKPTLDWLGVILSALGLFSIVFGIIESSTYGWWKATATFHAFGHAISLGSLSIVPVAVAIGFVLVGLFIWWEQRMERLEKTPLVSMSLFKNLQFTAGTVTTAIMSLGLSGLVFALPVFLQGVKGLDAFHTGLALLPLSATSLIAAPLAAKISHKIDPKYLIQFGLLVMVGAMFWLRATLSPDATIGQFIPVLIVYGVGMGFIMSPIGNVTLSAVPVYQAGEASGVNNTLRQVGQSLGSAIIGAALIASLSGFLTQSVMQSQVIPETAKAQIIQQVAGPTSDVEFGVASPGMSQAPAAVQAEMTRIINESTTKANKDALLYGILFVFLGFLASLTLPKTRHAPHPATPQSHDEQDELPVPQTVGKKKLAGLIVLAAAGLSSGIIMIKHNTPNTATVPASVNQQQTAQLLPDPKTPPQPSSSSTAPSAIPSHETSGQTATSTPAAEQKPDNSGAATPAAPEIITYRNAKYGFSFLFPQNWQTQERVADNEVIITGPQGQNITVQTFANAPATLQDIKNQLQSSPSVSNLRDATVDQEPALIFSDSSGRVGVAVIHRGSLYYMFNNPGNQAAKTFKFL